MVVLVVVAVMVPHAIAGAARRSVVGLAAAAGVTLVICGYALWIQFHGPLAEHGSPWKSNHFRNRVAAFVAPAGNMLLHTFVGSGRRRPASRLRLRVRRLPRLATAPDPRSSRRSGTGAT